MPRVTVTIASDGTTLFKVEGEVGPGCTDLTRSLQKALGKTVKDVKTDEFYQTESTSRRETVSQ